MLKYIIDRACTMYNMIKYVQFKKKKMYSSKLFCLHWKILK